MQMQKALRAPGAGSQLAGHDGRRVAGEYCLDRRDGPESGVERLFDIEPFRDCLDEQIRFNQCIRQRGRRSGSGQSAGGLLRRGDPVAIIGHLQSFQSAPPSLKGPVVYIVHK
jgi:hypothetical protein